MNEEQHDYARCNQCVQAGERGTSAGGHGFPDQRIHPEMPDYGLTIVFSVNKSMTLPGEDRIDICLFALDMMIGIDSNVALAVVVEDLIQRGYVHHTIQHNGLGCPSVYVGRYIWNLPLPYRFATDAERFCLRNWVCQLRSTPDIGRPRDRYKDEWEKTQMLLYYLSIGGPQI